MLQKRNGKLDESRLWAATSQHIHSCNGSDEGMLYRDVLKSVVVLYISENTKLQQDEIFQ